MKNLKRKKCSNKNCTAYNDATSAHLVPIDCATTDKQKYKEGLKAVRRARKFVSISRVKINEQAELIINTVIHSAIRDNSLEILKRMKIPEDVELRDRIIEYTLFKLDDRIARSVVRKLKKEYKIK